jgi:hypothetical protein
MVLGLGAVAVEGHQGLPVHLHQQSPRPARQPTQRQIGHLVRLVQPQCHVLQQGVHGAAMAYQSLRYVLFLRPFPHPFLSPLEQWASYRSLSSGR